ncbi:matrixin family metalloprotease [Akkermansiaceae bacterium]|nr:matrixin family metalloprotease [Akkermansiaceae bacterium]MDB4436030.1 matrixin family metalloprotease [Akkermansiaceae bacterium]MDB4508320.1 matrixin family metalloprotease [Akkermansiaceae bacterium]
MAYHAAEEAADRQNSTPNQANQFLDEPKWSNVASDSLNHSAQGDPVRITWSIVPDGTLVPNGDSGNGPSDFRTWIRGIYGGNSGGAPELQPWFSVVKEAFDLLEDECGITFVYEPNDDSQTMSPNNPGILGIRGDIRIGANFIDGPSNVLAFAYAPNYGDIVFDSADTFFTSTSNNSIGFVNVMAHELGHAIGLAHVCPVNQTKLMEPFINTSFRGPQFDETYSLQRQYGDLEETLGSSTNNNVVRLATPLNLADDQRKFIQWLSIDSASDVDFFSFSTQEFQKLRVILSPLRSSYLEGEQNTLGCTNGTTFNPSNRQNLGFQIIDSDRSTVLSTVNANSAGSGENLINFEFEAAGRYYIKVFGDGADRAQLYSLGITIGGAPPSALVRFGSDTIIAESGSVKNGYPDPGETISVDLSLVNLGSLVSSNLKATFSPPEQVTLSASELDFDDPGPGDASTQNINIMFGETCGQIFNIPVTIEDDSGVQSQFTLSYQVGLLEEGEAYREDFDLATTLPDGWTPSVFEAGEEWRVVSDEDWSAPNSVFSPGDSLAGSSTLTSTSLELGSAGNVLKFVLSYDLEGFFDGAVLEASLSGGEWFDLPTHPEIESERGGYSGSIFGGITNPNPLRGRSSWTGNSGGFKRSSFALPDTWGDQDIRFRWIIGSDKGTASDGIYLDRIILERQLGICEQHRPFVNITTLGAKHLQEGNPESSTMLTASLELPIAKDLFIPLSTSGSAEANDFSGNLNLFIPAGSTSASVTLLATADESTEGPETLTIFVPDNAENFTAAEGSSRTLSIVESVSYESWAKEFLPEGTPLEADSDLDGWSNLEEYFLETTPTDPSSRRILSLNLIDGVLEVSFADLPEREDGEIGIQLSPDLETWTDATVDRSQNSLRVTPSAGQRYLRLTFSLN